MDPLGVGSKAGLRSFADLRRALQFAFERARERVCQRHVFRSCRCVLVLCENLQVAVHGRLQVSGQLSRSANGGTFAWNRVVKTKITRKKKSTHPTHRTQHHSRTPSYRDPLEQISTAVSAPRNHRTSLTSLRTTHTHASRTSLRLLCGVT